MRNKTKNLCRYGTFLALAAWLTTGQSLSAQTGPTGFWDFSISGKQRGVAVVEFVQDSPSGGTLEGVQIVTLKRGSTKPPSSNPRTGNVDNPRVNDRTGENEAPTSSNTETNVDFFGGALLEGSWTFGSRGSIIGFYTEVSEINDGETIVGKTNGVSFTASFLPNRRLTLRADSAEGRTKLLGMPSTHRDISGDYFVQARRNKIFFVETLELTALPDVPNVFVVVGEGPGYTFTGMALMTSKGHLAIQAADDAGTGFKTLYGSYNFRKNFAKLKGLNTADENLVYVLTKQ